MPDSGEREYFDEEAMFWLQFLCNRDIFYGIDFRHCFLQEDLIANRHRARFWPDSPGEPATVVETGGVCCAEYEKLVIACTDCIHGDPDAGAAAGGAVLPLLSAIVSAGT